MFLTEWVKKHRIFSNYFLISVFVTVIDVIVSRGCELFAPTVVANTIGVVVGFILQYILCTKKVYAGSSIRTLIIFFLTWVFALVLADSIVYLVRETIFSGKDGFIYFAVGKGCSIVIPFFITYFIRKKLIEERKGA